MLPVAQTGVTRWFQPVAQLGWGVQDDFPHVCGVLPEMGERLVPVPVRAVWGLCVCFLWRAVAPGHERNRWKLQSLLKAQPGLTPRRYGCPLSVRAAEDQPGFRSGGNSSHLCREERGRRLGRLQSGTQGNLMGTRQKRWG